MRDGPEKPVTNEEIAVTLDDLAERLELLEQLLEQLPARLRAQMYPTRVIDARRPTAWLPCGCLQGADGPPCPAHVGIANMAHPERP